MRGWGGGTCVSIISIGYAIERERGGEVGGEEEGGGSPFWFPEHKSTNTAANPSVISLDTVFCLFEYLGPILTREGGRFNIVERGCKLAGEGWRGQVQRVGGDTFIIT